MTPEQLNTLLSTIFDGISKVGTVLIAVFSLWFQGRQEAKRTELQSQKEREQATKQRDWTVDDRNIARKWAQSDQEKNRKAEYILQHKRFLDDYTQNLLSLTDRACLRANGHEGQTLEKLNMAFMQAQEQLTEAFYHVKTFDNAELEQNFNVLMAAADEHLGPMLNNPKENAQKAAAMRGLISSAAAKVAASLESIVIEKLRTDDWQ